MTTARTAPGPSVRDLERIELSVADGTTMFAHVARPPKTVKNPPGILVLQDAYGWTGFLADVAQRFADAGFVAIAPELYHRNGPGITLSYDDEAIITTGDARPKTNPAGLIADGEATYAWLRSEIGNDRIAAFGFCMGGRMAYLLNAHVPLKAAVSFYGSGVPNLLQYAGKQHGTMLMIWAGQDHHIDAAEQRAVYDGLTAAGAQHEQVVFSEAKHGFFCHVRPWVYSESASRQSWALSLELFRVNGILD